MFSRIFLMLALILGLLLPLAKAEPVQAKEVEIGYLWSLYFDFEQNFDGILTIEVGPWKNGELTSVTGTSQATVRCRPIGNVSLDKGDAVFEGAGHVECAMDLGQIVWNNHNLVINGVDNYGSMVLRARVNSFTNAVSPILTHPDAAWSLDFSQTHSVAMNQELWNNAGSLDATFPGVTINTWQTYTYLYSCISNGGPCDATFGAGAQMQGTPTAGSRTLFTTGPVTFDIGRNGAAFFTGRMDSVLIDPGNSAH
jgi:hypothetical protein